MKTLLSGLAIVLSTIFFSTPAPAMSAHHKACLKAHSILTQIYPQHKGKGNQIRGCSENVFAFTLAVVEVMRTGNDRLFRYVPTTVHAARTLHQRNLTGSITYLHTTTTDRLIKQIGELKASHRSEISKQLATAGGKACYQSVRGYTDHGDSEIDDCITDMFEAAAEPSNYKRCFDGLVYCARKAPEIYKGLSEASSTVKNEVVELKETMEERKSDLSNSKGACNAFRDAKRTCKDANNSCKVGCKSKSKRSDRRKCRRACRKTKRSCISALVDEKAACKKRRRAVAEASLDTVTDTLEAADTVRAASKQARDAYDTLLKCKQKLSFCSAL